MICCCREDGNGSVATSKTEDDMKYRVHFFDKNGDETRSLVVDADDKDSAEDVAESEADERGWPANFRICDAEPVEE